MNYIIDRLVYNINSNLVQRDNGALEALIEHLREDGTQPHLVEPLVASWEKHTGTKCKFLTYPEHLY